MVFFALAPVYGAPLSYDQSYIAIKQIAPIFIGYVGQAAYYVTRQNGTTGKDKLKEGGFIYILSVGPFLVFTVIMVAIIFAFTVSNNIDSPPDTGMSFARLTDWISILLGLFSASVSVITAWLFGNGESK
ncbi:hypothetical protein [Rhizobium rosettiformans]|uniref:hypothetical protein n=2 Tax=Rhizobium TaxID=379 RepID=UPI0019336BD2|nr:hypothetical protein [Rhizobium rosettiformans]